MSQERITIDGWGVKQPDRFEWSFSTTSTEDSGRPMSGRATITPMFTVEAFDVEYSDLTISQAKMLLQAIVQRPGKAFFNLHYFSPYFGVWRTSQFYVGEGSLAVKTLKVDEELMQSISCSFVGRDKLC